jgi:hypothetical protein
MGPASFFFEVPFTPSGDFHGSVDEQHKRKIVKRVAHPFPYLLRRQKVTDTSEVTDPSLWHACLTLKHTTGNPGSAGQRDGDDRAADNAAVGRAAAKRRPQPAADAAAGLCATAYELGGGHFYL